MQGTSLKNPVMIEQASRIPQGGAFDCPTCKTRMFTAGYGNGRYACKCLKCGVHYSVKRTDQVPPQQRRTR